MKKSSKTKKTAGGDKGADPIAKYSKAQPQALKAICEHLRGLIDSALPKASSKVWHGSPVWFMDDNTVVGYNATGKSVNLLFWNGQAFDEAGLQAVGKYRAAQVAIADAAEIDPKVVRRLLRKAKADVFDSKAFFKKLREKR
jgi:hypothetical protein